MRTLWMIAAMPAILACGLASAPTPAPSFGREQAIAFLQTYLSSVYIGTRDASEALNSAATELFDDQGRVRGTWDASQVSDDGGWLVSVVVKGRGAAIRFRLAEDSRAVAIAEP